MKSFSERKGLSAIRTEIQTDSIDDTLRNRLWNVLDFHCWNQSASYGYYITIFGNSLLKKLWHSYFKRPVDTLDSDWSKNYRVIRTYFFTCQWFEVYDFMEFIANNVLDEEYSARFMDACNNVLESELSAFRFIGKQVTQITSKEEIIEIEQALEVPLETVRKHLEDALKLMSDRESPNYRNSIKESISAVEGLCRIITNDNNATLGKALDTIEKEGKIEWHGALKKAFDSLYGYTSSAEGIRHSLLEDKTKTLNFEDAKFMLVSCSAFVNYLVSKASKAGLELMQNKK